MERGAGLVAGGDPSPLARVRRRARLLRGLGRLLRGGSTAAAAVVALLAVALAVLFATAALPSIQQIGPGFLTGRLWAPADGVYGALPAVVGTLITSALALVFAVPVALGVAVLASEFAPARLRGLLVYFVDLGAAIPSIVYGFWALAVLKPVMESTIEPALSRLSGGQYLFAGPPLGLGVLTASTILGIMIVPTIAAFSREALRAVPRQSREAALSLGGTRWEATRIAVLGPAAPGIVGAIVLGLGRAVGETIAVALVIGGGSGIPSTLLGQGATIPSTLVNGLTDSVGLQLSALYELALLLLLISFAINVGARWLLRRVGRPGPPRSLLPSRVRGRGPLPQGLPPREVGGMTPPAWWPKIAARQGILRARRRRVQALVVLLVLLALATAVYPLVSLVRVAVENGGPAVVQPSFYTSLPPAACGVNQTACPIGGIGPAIQGTFVLLALGSLVGLPLGFLAGVYLAEYGRRRLGGGVSLVVDALVGVPSILVGAFVLTLFLRFDALDARTALAGGLALGVLMVPIVAKATETALRTVPAAVRESALALGFPPHRVTGRVVLGTCRSALVTGVLFAVMRAGGEAAAVIVTAGTSQFWLPGFRSPTAALAPFIYNALTVNASPNYTTDAWGAALVLLLIMGALGLAARLALRTGNVPASE